MNKCGDHRNAIRTRESCQRKQKTLHSFVDRMLEKHVPEEDSVKSATAVGGRYDPAVYKLIQSKRSHYSANATVRKFDERVRQAAKDLDSREVA